MSRLFRWLGCAHEEILARCPTEGMRFSATGAVILVAGGLAFGSAALTAHLFLHLSTFAAIALGVAWGLGIITLDRWLQMVIRRQPNPLWTLAIALPRVAIAVLASLVIAVSVVLVAFQSAVTTEAQSSQRQALLAAVQKVDGKYGPSIKSLTAREATLEQRIATVPNSSALNNDSLYRSDSAQAANLEAEANAAMAAALRELDGSGGTHQPGQGPVYRTKLAHAQQLQAEANAAQAGASSRARTLVGAQAAATGQAHAYGRVDLAQVRSQLATLLGKRSRDEAAVRDYYSQPIGLAERLDALSALYRKHPGVHHWSVLLTILILLFDSAPAVGKALLAIAPPTPYDHVQAEEERVARAAAKADSDARIQAAKIAVQEHVDQARMHRQKWQQELPDLIGKVVDTQREVTEQHIEAWSKRTRAHVSRWIRSGEAADAREGVHGIRHPTSSNESGGAAARNRFPVFRLRTWRRR